MAKGPYLPDLEPFIAAGIDPKTHLPKRIAAGCKSHLKEDVKCFLRLIDEQDAVNRYQWYNLPNNVTSQELEKWLYYKGQLCFFYDKNTEEFYFMPYTLDGTLDLYGRYRRIHPLPMNASGETKENKRLADYLSTIKLDVVYGMKLEELTEDDVLNSAVLLHDYTKQRSENLIPRQQINDPLLDTMAECVPMARTARLLSTGIKGIRVNDEDTAGNVDDANRQLENAALNGEAYVPIVGQVEMQDLQGGQVAKSEEYMMAMQSLDNLRLSGYGIDNGGLFQKENNYVNKAQSAVAGGPVNLVLQDGLSIRQNFCNIVNSIWGLGIWCEPSQNLTAVDTDGDGVTYEENQGENSGMDESEDNANE